MILATWATSATAAGDLTRRKLRPCRAGGGLPPPRGNTAARPTLVYCHTGKKFFVFSDLCDICDIDMHNSLWDSVLLKPFGVILEGLSSLGRLLGSLEALLEPPGALLDASWSLLGHSWEGLGSSWAPLDPSWRRPKRPAKCIPKKEMFEDDFASHPRDFWTPSWEPKSIKKMTPKTS